LARAATRDRRTDARMHGCMNGRTRSSSRAIAAVPAARGALLRPALATSPASRARRCRC
jgi:hypothetical protein